ncbi:MAG: hypothetical protein AAGD96_16920 [Chloroflexota bacterium]
MNILRWTLAVIFGAASIWFYLFFILQLIGIITGVGFLSRFVGDMPQDLITYTIDAPKWFTGIIPVASAAGIMGGVLLIMRYPMSLPMLVFSAAAFVIYVLIALFIFDESNLFGQIVTIMYTQVLIVSIIICLVAWFVLRSLPT